MGNAALALLAAHAAHLCPVTAELAAAALPRVSWPGRLQRLTAGRLVDALGRDVWLDGGHNPSAGQALAPVLAEWAKSGPVDLILGMQTTKDPKRYLAPLVPHLRRVRTVRVDSAPAPFPAEDLARIARETGVKDAAAAPGWRDALAEAAAGNGRLLIAGSLYLVGEVLADNRSGAPE